MPTSELEKHLSRLVSAMRLRGAPSSWSRVLLVEDASITHGTPSLIPRGSLVPAADYAARFDAHLGAGHSWINMSAAGILDDALLVIIELPGYENNVPRERVSVNLSGPPLLDGEPQWDASRMYRVVGQAAC